MQINFTFERETKNAVRFSEDVESGERGIIGTLYILKSAYAELGDPKSLTVTLAAKNASRKPKAVA